MYRHVEFSVLYDVLVWKKYGLKLVEIVFHFFFFFFCEWKPLIRLSVLCSQL